MEQLELFSDSGLRDIDLASEQKTRGSSFFYWFSAHEKFIFATIALFVIVIVSFCFGIERGRRFNISQGQEIQKIIHKTPLVSQKEETTSLQGTRAPLKKEVLLVQPDNTRPKSVQPQIKTPSADSRLSKNTKKENIAKETNKGYFIQVASCKQRSNAQKIVSLLKAKGYNAFSVTKGQYQQVCIGGFSKKESATVSLTQIKKSYKDSCIRRI